MVRSGFSLPPPSDLTKRTQRGYKTCEPIFRSSLSPLYFPLSLYFIYFLFVFFFLGRREVLLNSIGNRKIVSFFFPSDGGDEKCVTSKGENRFLDFEEQIRNDDFKDLREDFRRIVELQPRHLKFDGFGLDATYLFSILIISVSPPLSLVYNIFQKGTKSWYMPSVSPSLMSSQQTMASKYKPASRRSSNWIKAGAASNSGNRWVP